MLVRLTKKLAEVVNGLDLSQCAEGDLLDLSERDARMLLAEGWAEEVAQIAFPAPTVIWRPDKRDVAADRPRRDRVQTGGDELIERLRFGAPASWRKRNNSDPEAAT